MGDKVAAKRFRKIKYDEFIENIFYCRIENYLFSLFLFLGSAVILFNQSCYHCDISPCKVVHLIRRPAGASYAGPHWRYRLVSQHLSFVTHSSGGR